MDRGDAQSNGEVTFSGTGSADENQILGDVGELRRAQGSHARFGDRGLLEVKGRQIPMQGKARGLQLILQGPRLPIRPFGIEQLLEPRLRQWGWLSRRGHQICQGLCHAIETQGVELRDEFSPHRSPPAGGADHSGHSRPAVPGASGADQAFPAVLVAGGPSSDGDD